MALKVQPASTSHFLLLLFLGYCLALTGCNGEDEEVDPAAEGDRMQVADDRFGDPYEFRTVETPAAFEEPPGIANDSLFANVAYEGGCRDHDFDLHHEVARDTTRLWLSHRNRSEDCDELIRDELAFELPDEALESSTILLLNPQGDEPFVLRWGEFANPR